MMYTLLGSRPQVPGSPRTAGGHPGLRLRLCMLQGDRAHSSRFPLSKVAASPYEWACEAAVSLSECILVSELVLVSWSSACQVTDMPLGNTIFRYIVKCTWICCLQLCSACDALFYKFKSVCFFNRPFSRLYLCKSGVALLMSVKLLAVYTVGSKFIPQGFALDPVTNDGNTECKKKSIKQDKTFTNRGLFNGK